MWGRQTVNNQASFVKQFLGDSSFFLSKQWCGVCQGTRVQVIAELRQRNVRSRPQSTLEGRLAGRLAWSLSLYLVRL